MTLFRASRKKIVTSFGIAAVILFFCAGLFQHFVLTLPQPPQSLPLQIDGIVVATGGQGRIHTGLVLLEQTNARTMLITGVGSGIDKNALKNSLNLNITQSELFACCVEIDSTALDTAGNAAATEKWAADNQLSNLLLVTANYHLPRAKILFSRLDSGLSLSFWAVIPQDLKINTWYASWPHLRLLGREFAKFTLARTGIV